MDNDELLAHARTRFDHESARRVLREKYQAKMLFAYCGGLWRAGPELQMVLMSCDTHTAVITDIYDNPVQVQTQGLLELSRERWQEQMSAWLTEHQELSQNR